MEKTFTFNEHDISALLLGLSYSLDSVKSSIDAYTKSGDIDLINEERELLSTIKSLYKRFLPNVPECDLPGFSEGGED